jgi:hypothetical protein
MPDRERPIDTCAGCGEEREIVALGLCRKCYQRHYRDEEAKRTRYNKTKAQVKLEIGSLNIINNLVKLLVKARHIGMLELLEPEAREAITLLIQELVELQRKAIGKSPSAIFEEIVEEAGRERANSGDEAPEPEAEESDMGSEQAAGVIAGESAKENLGLVRMRHSRGSRVRIDD